MAGSKKGHGKQQKDNQEGVYDVEAIIDKKMQNGMALYLVKWKNWGSRHNTWEPLSNLTGCDSLLEMFEKTGFPTNAKARQQLEVKTVEMNNVADGPEMSDGAEEEPPPPVLERMVGVSPPPYFEPVAYAPANAKLSTFESNDSSAAPTPLQSLDQNGSEGNAVVASPTVQGGEYVVEAILDKKFIEGKLKYHVKWKGWQSSDNTWEPFENLSSCRKLIAKFDRTGRPTNFKETPKKRKALKRAPPQAKVLGEGAKEIGHEAHSQVVKAGLSTVRANGGINGAAAENTVANGNGLSRGKNGSASSSKRGSGVKVGKHEVENIVGKQVVGGVAKYEVKWKNWASEYNTWEPVENLKGCQRMVQAFEKKQATSNKTTKRMAEESVDELRANGQTVTVLEKCPRGLTPVVIQGVHRPLSAGISMSFVVQWVPKSFAPNSPTEVHTIQAEVFRKRYPFMVLDFYERHINWDSIPPMPEKKKRASESSAMNIQLPLSKPQ